MPGCPDGSSTIMRTQRGHLICGRGRDQENKDAKRRRRNAGGRWVATKGDDLMDNGMEDNSSKGGRKRPRR